MNFTIQLGTKILIFDSDLVGMSVAGREYVAGKDGMLIYDQVKELQADSVSIQMTTNTSTLIPALKVLGIPYNEYFDRREVVDSQNDISYYWNPSKLAAYYNRFSTDDLDYSQREPVIRKAVEFLVKNVRDLPGNEEMLTRVLSECKLLGFYQGLPIFDGSTGFAKLTCRMGIHVDSETVMVSTPMDKYEADIYEVADKLAHETAEEYTKKKNRVVFLRNEKIMKSLGLSG